MCIEFRSSENSFHVKYQTDLYVFVIIIRTNIIDTSKVSCIKYQYSDVTVG